ncbi:MAG TPA: phage major capsid protein [Alphaproteobacteria bacterium]|jgi:HK97 family phage prohead protease
MDRAYSLLTVKAVDDDQRIIRGTATTPSPDRVGDIVEPLGVLFNNPMSLLHQHDNKKPVGTVVFDKPTKNGITFEAHLPKIEIAGPLKDRVDTAWGEVKAGLVRAVSIGFRPLEYSFMENGGIRYTETEVIELSLVTIPANAEATITQIKSIDAPVLAATGKEPKTSDRPVDPGASGTIHKTVKLLKPKENTMKTIAEQISAYQSSRDQKFAKMTEIMNKSAEAGETLSADQTEEYDTLDGEVKAIDAHLVRLATMEANAAKSAKPVIKAMTVEEGGAARAGVVVKASAKLQPGVAFARFAKVKAVSRLDNIDTLKVAERMYGADSDVVAMVKANEVTPGSNISGNWASDLTGPQGSTYADFAEFLRPATILGKFGVGSVPGLRKVPFREPLISQTGGGAGYWVGEGKPKPLTSFDFDRTTIEPLKVANIAVLTEENVRSSNPSSELIVRDALRDALVATQDTAFIDPTNAGTSNVKPASITNGAAAIASTGTDADHVRLDVRAVFQKFIDADNPPESGVWIMSTSNALALSLMVNTLGQREFPEITMRGGFFEGMPVLASRYAGTNVALVNASDIYEADDGDVTVDMSREASLEMKSATLSQDGSAGTGASLVSLWQNNLVGLRAEKTINWKRRRASGVAYLTGVAWGGAVPAS